MKRHWEVISDDGRMLDPKFPWGKPLKVYTIGNIDILEFEVHPGMLNHDYKKYPIEYQIYIDGKDCCISARTLDEAMLVALAEKYDGRHSRASMYMARLINMKIE